MTDLNNNERPDQRITFIATPPLQDMINRLVDKLATKSMTDVIRQAVSNFYYQHFKDYIEVQREKKSRSQMGPEERATKEVVREEKRTEVRKARIYEKGLAICKALGGETEGPRGSESCRFKTFAMMNPNYAMAGEMVVPFDSLDQSHIEKQYDGGGIINDLPLAERKKKILKVLK